MHKEWLGILAIAVGFAGDVTYTYSILKGKSRPHMFSWIIWSVVGGVTFAAQYVKQAGAGAWLTAYGAATCVFFAILAWRQGSLEASRFDYAAFAVALAAIPLWYLTGDPLWSMLLVTAINIVGCYFTIKKGYFKPYEENVFCYAAFGLMYYIGLFALESYSFVTVFYPAFSAVFYTGFVALLVWRRAGVRRLASQGL